MEPLNKSIEGRGITCDAVDVPVGPHHDRVTCLLLCPGGKQTFGLDDVMDGGLKVRALLLGYHHLLRVESLQQAQRCRTKPALGLATRGCEQEAWFDDVIETRRFTVCAADSRLDEQTAGRLLGIAQGKTGSPLAARSSAAIRTESVMTGLH